MKNFEKYKKNMYTWKDIKDHFDPANITTIQDGIYFVFNCGVKSLHNNDNDLVTVYSF